MASTFHSIADPSSIEAGTTADVEQNAEVPVQARRDWSVDEVKAEYREWSEKGIAALAGMQEPPMAEMVAAGARLLMGSNDTTYLIESLQRATQAMQEASASAQ
jgi:hypothetical protein